MAGQQGEPVAEQAAPPIPRPVRWVKVLDQTKCIGCHACTTACKSENAVPLGVTRTYVKSVDVGVWPQSRRNFQVTRCNQCEDPPCVAACPTTAMYRREDGIVDFDKSICIGCKACMAACPYDAIFINPEDHSAEKCNFCAHRLEVGLEPACVVVCPTQAILVGDLNDPDALVSQLVNRQPVTVRRPEKGTSPNVFYRGAHQATLDPLMARQPGGDTYAFSQIPRGAHLVQSGRPAGSAAGSSAAALLSYDIGHALPWGWRVSLYTVTKGIAAGTYLMALLLAIGGQLSWQSTLYRLGAPLASLLFLGVTGVLLIWDLKHPFRFYLIFLKPQWRSWLVRGSFIIGAYGAVLLAQLGAGAAGAGTAERVIAVFGLPLSVATAVYTAFLFGQSKGRDLWQSSLLGPALVVQSGLAGGAALLISATIMGSGRPAVVAYALAGAAALVLLLQLAEAVLTHPTEHAHLAAREMMLGALAPFWWTGCVLVAVAIFAPALALVAAVAALIGLAALEHAFVQAGQRISLA